MKLKVLLLLHALFLQTFFTYRRKIILDKDNNSYEKLKRNCITEQFSYQYVLKIFLYIIHSIYEKQFYESFLF